MTTSDVPARPPARRRRIVRIGIVLLALILLVTVVGAGYETLSERGDDKRYPMPGRLVDAGGHKLHLNCTGTGGPTVVLEAGLGESSAGWATIQGQLSGGGRVCSYDRAGYAWSEPGPGPRTAGRAADELHTMLLAAGEPGPYVFVAHSYGGHIVRLFADRWPESTRGMVLLDVSDENATTALKAAKTPLTVQFAVQRGAARLGAVRLFGGLLIPDNAPSLARRAAPVVYGPGSLAAGGAEVAASLDSAGQVRTTVRPTAWGDRPVAVIAAGGQPATALDPQRRLAELSSRGCFVIADTTDHYIHYAEPDLVVRVTQDVRGGTC
ncbi:alpha/beta fold hydrolase [Dactylosporangium sp. CA-233914]|uniref:alpha/beta fold hydrolase n=1 Tax=Dactylosporangium sp. CA-233914 TaxID=3239934 RepID=UPI003D8C7B2C